MRIEIYFIFIFKELHDVYQKIDILLNFYVIIEKSL